MLSRYLKQELFRKISREGQDKIRDSRVAIVGCGALGSRTLELLARAGTGYMRLIDRDIVELENLQRQTLYTEKDAHDKLPKVIAADNHIKDINSEVKIECCFSDLNTANINELLGNNIDLILDGTDNFETRYLLNDFAFKKGIPWVYASCLGSYGLVKVFTPGSGCCLRCIIETVPEPGSVETCDTAGILNTIAGIISAFQSTEALKLLTGNEEDMLRKLLVVDCWDNQIRQVAVEANSKCEVCMKSNYEFLNKSAGSFTNKLCGRNSVYINPASGSSPRRGSSNGINLAEMKKKLSGKNAVLKEYMLVFKVDDYEVNLFADGRAIIKGTEDLKIAKSIYARYIGV